MTGTSTEETSKATSSVTDQVIQALLQCLSNATYACGGTIKATHLKDSDATVSAAKAVTGDQVLAHPITIRWDSAASIEKLTLPLSNGVVAEENDPIMKLVADTQPASFGFQGKDVIDESYRKASKLDTTAFSTNFCPYESGIIDVIGQTLLPKHPSSSQGIRAELYKLNIYQAPSGFFRAHVDTPRSELQFGSLVVCLPCEHEGGQLVVRHQGQTMTFDWSGPSKDIKWAAFYSDCEHEVLEITSGHRITLTYNLYMRRGLGEIAGHSETLDAHQLPMYEEVKSALAKPDFMAEGGTLGKYCSHAYAHATDVAATALPSILKGSDMVMFEVFRSLGLETSVRPVIDHINKHFDSDSDEEDESNESDEEDEEEKSKFRTGDYIGKEFTRPINIGMKVETIVDIELAYTKYTSTRKKVTWINAPRTGTEAVQFAYMAYGNQGEAAFEYSFCALLFEIPPYSERVEFAKKHVYSG